MNDAERMAEMRSSATFRAAMLANLYPPLGEFKDMCRSLDDMLMTVVELVEEGSDTVRLRVEVDEPDPDGS